MIGCVMIPYFAAAIERRAEPALAASPLVIAASHQVLAVSKEAAQAGVLPRMSLRQAQALCPQATFIAAHPDEYQNTFAELLDILTQFTSRVEPEDSQQAALLYLDLEPLTPKDQVEVVYEMGQALHNKIGLQSATGLANGKFPAYVAATSIGLNRTLFIVPGEERSFLAPLPVAYLSLEADLARRFRLLGLDTLGQFARLPAGAVLTQFGYPGNHLHKLARGEDDRPVAAYPPPPAETMTQHLDGPVADRLMLEALCQHMALALAARLEAQGQMAWVIGLTLQLEDGTRWKERRILRQPVHSAERLGLNLRLFLERVRVSCGVEAVTVELADLTPLTARQLDLFANPTQLDHEQRLNELLPGLTARYGTCFYEVALTNPRHRLPEFRSDWRERR